MTKVKFCGLKSENDVAYANEFLPDYAGFVFAPASKRYVSPEKAKRLKEALDGRISAVGVFVNESADRVADMLNGGIIDIAQLHGDEDEIYIEKLRAFSEKPIIKAFIIKSADDIKRANACSADYVLLDSGRGSGEQLDFSLLKGIERPFFLAGGLSPENAETAIITLRPYALDVSSGIETGGSKDKEKMAAFMKAVRKADDT